MANIQGARPFVAQPPPVLPKVTLEVLPAEPTPWDVLGVVRPWIAAALLVLAFLLFLRVALALRDRYHRENTTSVPSHAADRRSLRQAAKSPEKKNLI